MRGASMCRVAAVVFVLFALQLSPVAPGEALGQTAEEVAPPPSFGVPDSVSIQPPAAAADQEMTGTEAGFSPGKASGANIKSIVFSPVSPIAKDPITVQVQFDRGFAVPAILGYRWKINGQVVQESLTPTLSMPTKRGDVVEVTVFPEEIRSESRAVSASVKVGGAPPTITKTQESMDENGRYVARYEVQHPDGDPVTVSLSKGPKGMVLDTANKELVWQVPPETKGNFPVELVAVDPSGAKVMCSYTITIRQEQQKPAGEKDASSKSK